MLRTMVICVVLGMFSAMVLGDTYYYVNGTSGYDGFDGTAPSYQGGLIGPKRTIQAGIDADETQSQATVVVTIAGGGVLTLGSGTIRISGNRGSAPDRGFNSGSHLMSLKDHLNYYTEETGVEATYDGVNNKVILNSIDYGSDGYVKCEIIADDNSGMLFDGGGSLTKYGIAGDPVTVVVADGTYTGNGNRDIDFGGRGKTVKSANGPKNCIIDCQGTSLDNHRGFYFHQHEGLDSVVDGFTITGGFADYGGAIHCLRAGPTISNCIMIGNNALNHGGAINGPLDYDYIYASAADIDDIKVNYAALSGGTPMVVSINQTVQATRGIDTITGPAAGVAGGSVTLQLSSNRGTAELTFADTTTIANMATAINAVSGITGVEATNDGILVSVDYGTNAFVMAEVTSTGTIAGLDGNKHSGVDARASVNGNYVTSKGRTLFVNLPTLNMEVTLSSYFGVGSTTINVESTSYQRDLGVVENCIISNNSAGGSGGAIAGNLGVITNCIINNNTAVDDGGGLCWNYGPITNCVITDNDADTGGGINISDADVTNSIIWANTAASAPQLNNTLDPTYTCVQGGANGTGNIDADPLFVDAANGDYHLQLASLCINAGTNNSNPQLPAKDLEGNPRILDGIVDMGVYEFGIRIYVDDDAVNDPGPGNPDISDPGENGSVDHPFDSIQEGINAANDGETVIVADGTYTGTGNRDIDFGGKAITVRSQNGSATCIIDCQGSESDKHRGFYFHSGEDLDSVLDGFTVKNGTGSGTSGWIYGGAIHCVDSSPTIANCVFRDNELPYDVGYGAAISNQNSDPSIMNCTFINNNSGSCGGAISNIDSDPIVHNCTFTDNRSTWAGGGIYNRNSSPTITHCTFNNLQGGLGGAIYNSGHPVIDNCTFIGNYAGVTFQDFGGGAIKNSKSSTPTITNCSFIGNSTRAGDGGGAICGGILTLANCLFVGNSVSGPDAQYGEGHGGAVIAHGSFTNCTFYGNSADIHGGGVYIKGGPATLTNCIFRANSDQDGIDESAQIDTDSQSININYSCIEGLTGSLGGTGNIGDDPLFVDPDGADNVVGTQDDNLRLQIISPCINTGTNSTNPPLPLTDLDGNPRIYDGIVEMGAYEVGNWIYVDDNAENDPGPGYSDVSDPGENGSLDHPFDSIQEAIDAANAGETIIVFDGTYSGTGNRDIDFGGRGITLQSANGPDTCIINCQGTSSQNHRGFFINQGEGLDTVVDGFTITGGFADYGGAIKCVNTGPTISNCNITGNTALYHGGAINGPLDYVSFYTAADIDAINVNYADLIGGAPMTVEIVQTSQAWRGSDTITGPAAGVAGAPVTLQLSGNRGTTELTFEDYTSIANMATAINMVTEITGVTADFSGVLVSVDYGANAFVKGEVTSIGSIAGLDGSTNSGADAVATVNSQPVASQGRKLFVTLLNLNMELTLSSSFSSASSTFFTIDSTNDQSNLGVVDNCIISNNSAGGNGGAIAGNLGAINNCVISNNSAVDEGGGLSWGYGSVTNSIIWANTAASNPQLNNTLDPTYTCVQGGASGIGNISDDPLFVDAANSDYHLLTVSPCIDAGDPIFTPAPSEVDIDGDPRIMGGLVDMGVDEFIPDCYTGPDYDQWVSLGYPPSWCNPRQCHGDADDAEQGFGSGIGAGTTRVGSLDLGILAASYNSPSASSDLRADFDHAEQSFGSGRGAGTTRTGSLDLGVLAVWYNNSAVPGDCQSASPLVP